MAITTVVRLGGGLLTSLVLARLLGPEAFGILMLWFSVATLLSIVANFGLIPYVLREIGANPATTVAVINEGFTGKLLLTMLVFGCAILASWALGIQFKAVFFCLLLAAVADSFSEFLNAGFRARDRFDVETRLATFTSISHAVIVTGAVFASPTIEVAAAAYAVSRLVVLAITLPAVARHFAVIRLADLDASMARLRSAFSYAIDFGFQSMFGQIDSVVLNHFIGPVAVGLFQAGMRVFQGGSSAAQVLANVFLPRAAGKAKEFGAFAKESNRIQIAFLSFGAVFGLTMAVLSDPIVQILFGPAYNALNKLFPLFGLLFFARFAAAAWGVVLTAAGEQRYRTIATATHWVLIACVAPILVPRLGVAGWLISVIIGNVLLGFLYALRGARRVATPWSTGAMTVLGGISFIPFVHV